jgi:signal transduction histidine kinase
VFRNLHISTKIFIILAPLLVVTFGAVVYSTYTFQEQQVLYMAQRSAQSEATLIKISLVHMMQTQEEVSDTYLRQLSLTEGVENLHILFHLDSLHLKPEYLTPFRIKKLQRRQQRVEQYVSEFADAVFDDNKPVWTLACDTSAHPDRTVHADEFRLASLEEGIPAGFWSCGLLNITQPFLAERKCLTCHQVEIGTVLGAASMEIPIGSTVMAIQDNAIRSISIFLILVGVVSALGLFIFRRFVAKPVEKLVQATETITVEDSDTHLFETFENDEFGTLARAFDEMRHRLKQAQDEIIQKERLSTIGQMASGIIHDFRNPMTNISVGLQVLESQRAVSNEKREEMFRIIRDAVDRMIRMTQELLEFARGKTTIHMAEVNLEDLVQQIESIVKPSVERSGVSFSIEIMRPGMCWMDGYRIQRSIVNLVNNADDVLKGNGHIAVRIIPDDTYVVFEIEDDGPGIPVEIQETLFDPFVTSGKSDGTGLGLAITKRVIEQHGGSIRFTTAHGKGTTFHIRIPTKLDATHVQTQEAETKS